MRNRRGLISAHIAVFLLGAASLFAALIPMSALMLTLGRAIFSALSLYIYIHFLGLSLRLNRFQDYLWNILAGIFLTCHWFFFVMAVQVSTVSIGTISFATYPLFVLFMEPYFFKEKFKYKNILALLLLVAGIGFLIPAFRLTDATTLGIVYGLISSFSFACLSVVNRRLASLYDSAVVTMYEQLVVSIIMTITISVLNPFLGYGTGFDFICLIVYGVIFTALAHTLYVRSLKHIKVQTASVISVLEPAYSIILAAIFLGERLSYQEILGIALIFSAVLLATRVEVQDEVSS
ncbi:MAG: DMT family transporter [Erysipelotrichaceae bacterium]|nr:DMT family transporter [Erysipelotrichaceae bacterium]